MKIRITKDINGNKTATVEQTKLYKKMGVNPFRAFSIQTNGNLNNCHKLENGEVIEAHSRVKYWLEIKDYVRNYGTKRQKQIMGW